MICKEVYVFLLSQNSECTILEDFETAVFAFSVQYICFSEPGWNLLALMV